MKEIYGNSFGNLISAYWTVRAYSIYNKIDFDFYKYLKLENRYHESYHTILNHLFRTFNFKIKYNPKYDEYLKNSNFNMYINDDYACNLLNIKNEITINKLCEIAENRILLYYSHSYIGSWTNIINIIQEETEYNISKYLKQLNQSKPFYLDNETVIHFRCGNVLIGHANQNYHILKFKYYRDNIKKNCKKITIIWKIDYNDKNTQIQVGYYERDLFIINNLKIYLESELNIDVNIDNQYFSDFIYMLYAPRLIVSPSSFSFWSGIMSINEVIIPKCNLFCGNLKPNIKKNLYWIDQKSYILSADEIYKTKNNNNDLLQKLLN